MAKMGSDRMGVGGNGNVQSIPGDLHF